MIRPKKEDVIRTAIWLVPEYFQIFRELRLNNKSGIGFQSEVQKIRSNLGRYVLIYDDERKIGRALLYATLGKVETDDYLKALNESPIKDLQDELDCVFNLSKHDIEEFSEQFQIPQTPKEWSQARDQKEQLPEDERRDLEFKGACFWSFCFTSLFNILSVMILGTKLTVLVTNALNGDDKALLKAVQIDKQLLISHPYFIERKQQLQLEQDSNEQCKKLLTKLVRVESKPMFLSKIQQPALYLLFGILETFNWLDDLTHQEMLDIYDSTGLDRYTSRIETLDNFSDRLREYRKRQIFNEKSMVSNKI